MIAADMTTEKRRYLLESGRTDARRPRERRAGLRGRARRGAGNLTSRYADLDSISDDVVQAMSWAVGQGIIGGVSL